MPKVIITITGKPKATGNTFPGLRLIFGATIINKIHRIAIKCFPSNCKVIPLFTCCHYFHPLFYYPLKDVQDRVDSGGIYI
jgi:hypothetical protein